MPELIGQLARQEKLVVLKPIETVSKIWYLGDMGGIVCASARGHREHDCRLAHSGTSIPQTPLATAVLDYQKHRVKKLRRQGYN